MKHNLELKVVTGSKMDRKLLKILDKLEFDEYWNEWNSFIKNSISHIKFKGLSDKSYNLIKKTLGI